MKRAKMIVAAVLAVFLIVVLFQNLEPDRARLLFVTVPMPRAVLLIVTYLLGVVTGLLVASQIARRPRKR